MNKLTAIETIKAATKAISALFSAEKEEDFEAVKRVDSDELVDVQGELAPGTAVLTSSAMGSQDAADDTYILSNGVEFSTKGGKIDKVIKAPEPVEDPAKPIDAPAAEPAPAEDAPAPDAQPTAEAAEPAPAPADNTAAIATLVQKITELDNMINTIKTALEGKASAQAMSALGEQFSIITKAFEVLSDTPAEFSKVDKSLEAKADKENRLNALASVWSKK